ncbi:hypothetical protein R1flu_029103 [Riccia fluitans]|uniref:C-terminal of Roc (COR) domain-containing protein n=1 Tax=Riccia fluitans TaxID=41844 RepID=A0ABD1XNN1_9MARC
MGSSSEDTLKRFAEHLQTQWSTVISLSNGLLEYNRFFENFPGEVSDLSGQQKRVLLEVLQAIGNCKLDQLIFDDVPGAELLSSEEWDSFFSSLLSGQTSPKRIDIQCTGTLYNTVCAHVGVFLAKSSTLELLCFQLPPNVRSGTSMIPLCSAAVRALSEGLVQTKCLKRLVVRRKEGAMADVLTSAFTGDVRNTSLESIQLRGGLERLGIALPALQSSNYQNLKEITLYLKWENVTQGVVDDFRKVAESFRTRESSVVDASRKVFLEFVCNTTAKFTEDDGRRAFSCLDSWADASERDPMLKTNLLMNFTGSGCGEQGNVKRGDVKGWFSHAVNRYIHLNGLQVTLWWMPGAVMDMDNFLLLCEGIQSNESVESLDVNYHGGGKASVDRKEEGKCAMVEEALRRNRAQASYFSTLRDARLPFENAKAGSIFLFGNPHAGKTRLRVSMMEARQKTSWVKKQLNKLFGLKQTKGVDVELLRDDEEMQVSIWDLAGQEIFRALQTLLLPTVTQACVFAFVFNPMKDDQHQQLEMKEDLEEAFGKELESWLRFIASNYPITGTFLPEVLVVITHRDRMKMHKMEKRCDWAERKVKHCQMIYEKALKLHEGFFYVDAQDVKEAKPFVERVFQLFSDMLQKSPQAPSVCSKLISTILNRPREVISHPVWQMEEFLTFVSKSLEALDAGCFALEVEKEGRVLEALSLYMHDVGSIFVLPHCKLVVVDINWLTHKFLGTLISEGHGFDVKTGIRSYSSPDGFMSKLDLDNILMSVSRRNHRKNITTQSQVLHDLLVSLDLCYQVESIKGDRFFIPTIFQRGEFRNANLSWETAESSDWQHFGYRLLCESRDTSSLTSVVFPRFQIHFRKEMMKRGEISGTSYDCQRDLIRLDWNGYFIIVENDGVAGDHVDFLVRFSKSKQQQEAMSFLKERLLETFRTFCASPEGCRGVTLVTAIIRPECVQKLTAREYREDQVILEKELKKRLREDMEKKLHQKEITWPAGNERGESSLNYEHTWPQMVEAKLRKCCQRAVELLEEKDVSEILKPLWEKEEATLQRRKEGLSRQKGDEGWSDEEGRPEKAMERRIHEHLQRGFEGVHNHLQEIHRDLSQQLRTIFDLQKQASSTL